MPILGVDKGKSVEQLNKEVMKSFVILIALLLLVFLSAFVALKLNPSEAKRNSNSNTALLRQPYLQTALADSITVIWRTSAAYNCALAYRQEGSQEWKHINGQINPKRVGGFENQVNLRGLQPGKLYQYRLFTNGQELAQHQYYAFRAPKPKDAPFSFFAVGDIGEPTTTQGKPDRLAAAIAQLEDRPDFGLLLGDLVYPNGASEGYDEHLFKHFEKVFSEVPTFVVPGNHDWMVDPAQNFEQEWKMPGNEHYYSFERGNALFIALDSKDGDFYQWEEQKAWLEKRLAQAQQQHYQWRIVMLHHNGKSCTYKKDTKKVIELYSLFTQYGIDLVLNGHAHTYERLNPIGAGGEVLPQGLHSTSSYGDLEGFISITVGSGGKLRGVGPNSPNFLAAPQSCRHSNLVAFSCHDWAFLRVKIDGDELLAEAISTLSGSVLDRFTINKQNQVIGKLSMAEKSVLWVP